MSQQNLHELGLRERKKIKTRRAIQQQALRLFREQGYHETTIEQIAEAAEVSTSTFFRYFPTKEDVVLYDDYDPEIIAAFLAEPPDVSVIRALRNAFAKVMVEMSIEERDVQLERSRLMMSVSEIRAGFFNNLAQAVEMIANAVAERTHRDSSDFTIRALAGALMGVGISVSFAWLENPQMDVMAALDEAMGYIEIGFPL